MSLDLLSTTFAALADPTLRAVLARLVSREASVLDRLDDDLNELQKREKKHDPTES